MMRYIAALCILMFFSSFLSVSIGYSSEAEDSRTIKKIYNQYSEKLIKKKRGGVKDILDKEPDYKNSYCGTIEHWYCFTPTYCLVVYFSKKPDKIRSDGTVKRRRYRCHNVGIRKKDLMGKAAEVML
ncbi:hypothetical protein [Desulfoluna butyratoxydans]|uniref:hypothetical protein n=1 Tax=Desulfoluna butyratoxydans TaxID=231438 RepID=UPI0015D20E92|nr:hypothetical protein [Desulfoluna butyratoxydans]